MTASDQANLLIAIELPLRLWRDMYLCCLKDTEQRFLANVLAEAPCLQMNDYSLIALTRPLHAWDSMVKQLRTSHNSDMPEIIDTIRAQCDAQIAAGRLGEHSLRNTGNSENGES